MNEVLLVLLASIAICLVNYFVLFRGVCKEIFIYKIDRILFVVLFSVSSQLFYSHFPLFESFINFGSGMIWTFALFCLSVNVFHKNQKNKLKKSTDRLSLLLDEIIELEKTRKRKKE